ncbi:MAG: bestrophin family protein [Balneola sp.]
MIIKRNFNPLKVWKYIQKPMWIVLIWSVGVWVGVEFLDLSSLAINFTPIGVLGSALAIFVAFRNNSSYSRWWEARQLWGNIQSSSRVLGRLIITFTDSHSHQENYNKERSELFKQELIYQLIGWVHLLRLKLRNQDAGAEIWSLFTKEAIEELQTVQNKPTYLQRMMGQSIYKAMANGTLGGFDSFQMEGQLLALSNYQAACERIKETPLPRQYDFFTRLFVYLFALMLPFGLLGLFDPTTSWMIIPASFLVSGVFVIMERTGAANEDPFENKITDIPMTAICNSIERDLKEMLGDEIPEKIKPEHGYLY